LIQDKLIRQLGGCVYSAMVPATRPALDHTAWIIPHRDGAAFPVEDAHILWQR
jgi:starch phosphorylase